MLTILVNTDTFEIQRRVYKEQRDGFSQFKPKSCFNKRVFQRMNDLVIMPEGLQQGAEVAIIGLLQVLAHNADQRLLSVLPSEVTGWWSGVN